MAHFRTFVSVAIGLLLISTVQSRVANDVTQFRPVANGGQSTMMCKVCGAFLEVVDGVLGDGQVEQRLDCDKLQGDDAQRQCKDIIDKYGYMLVYFLEKEKDGNLYKVCSDPWICPKVNPKPVLHPISAELVKRMAKYSARVLDDEDNCHKCQDLVEVVLEDLSNPDVQSMVAAYLSRVCSFVPFIEGPCISAIDQFTTMVMNSIVGDINSEDACNDMQFCPSSAVVTPDDSAKKLLKRAVFIS